MNLKEIYQHKKVFITGHTGFKGAWLTAWLHSLGANVKGYALAAGPDDLYTAINGNALCTSVLADVRNKEKLNQEMVAFAPDFVFHLAAQPLVRYSYSAPLETFDVNVMGTAHLLDAVRTLTTPCVVVVITTDKVYQNVERDYFYKEDDKLGGYDPYSASKAAAEIIVDAYRSSFFNPDDYTSHQKSVSSARAGNVIGGGDWAADRIVPDIIRALSAGEPVLVRNPASVRPWEHVLEPLHGYLLLAASQSANPVKLAAAYNFGPAMNETLSVAGLVTQAIKVWGSGSMVTLPQTGEPHEANLLQLNISKAEKELKWVPSFSVKEAVELTVNWYKAYNLQPHTAYDLLMNDIKKLSHD